VQRQLSVAIVGADHLNNNGGNRRSEIAFCDPGEMLAFKPEPNNPFDEHAIAVFSARGFQIGYVASQRAVFLKSCMRAGAELAAVFQDVAPWGAVARVGLNCAPILPQADQHANDDEPDTDRHEEPDFDFNQDVDYG
jgi:hypothetical protein